MVLSAKQSKLAALALLLVLIAVVARLAVWPAWQAYMEDSEAIVDGREKIERFERLSAMAEPLGRELKRLNNDRALDQLLFSQPTSTLAAAKLQERVKRIVEASGGRLTSTQVLGAERLADFERIGLSVRMSVTTEALQKLLHELEGGRPILIVDDLVVLARAARSSRSSRRSRNRRRAGMTMTVPTVTPQLDVRFKLTGFMRATPEADS